MISVRSEVQVLPGPPILTGIRGHSSAGRAPALQAGGRRFDPVWLHQYRWNGRRHSSRKQVCGRLRPSACSVDIVKRRFVRVPSSERGPGKLQDFSAGSCVEDDGPPHGTLNPAHMVGCLTAPPDRSREAGLFVPVTLGEIPMGIGNENDQVS